MKRKSCGEMGDNSRFDVYAIFKGKRKLIARNVGAFRATRVANSIEKKGFRTETINVVERDMKRSA